MINKNIDADIKFSFRNSEQNVNIFIFKFTLWEHNTLFCYSLWQKSGVVFHFSLRMSFISASFINGWMTQLQLIFLYCKRVATSVWLKWLLCFLCFKSYIILSALNMRRAEKGSLIVWGQILRGCALLCIGTGYEARKEKNL